MQSSGIPSSWETDRSRAGRWPLLVQGVYYMLSGVWPILSIRTFQMVTGPKTDLWLVRMVGLLAFTIGLTLFSAALAGRLTVDIVRLAIVSAIAFTTIDVVYVLLQRISPIYLGDAMLEILLITALGWALWLRRA